MISSARPALVRADVVIVGAGIVGLAHAVTALDRGLSVVVVERDERAVGASVRNFGHGCFTAQSGPAARYAGPARAEWVRLAQAAGFWLRECGTVVVARAEDEYAVLEDLHAMRGDEVVLLDSGQVRARVPIGADVIGGAFLPMDIRVDPRHSVGALAEWLDGQGVRFLWSTAMQEVHPGGVRTSRGEIEAAQVIVAVGHDIDRHFPEIASQAGMQRCALHMLRVANPTGATIDPAVFTGFSMLRYGAFAASPALATVRARLTREHGSAIDAGLNLMFTQRPDGDLTVGDTHAYGQTIEPFQAEAADQLVLDHVQGLLGTDRLRVRERWQGVYASAREPFLIAAPGPSVRVVSVTSGVGMTTALGLAQEVIAELCA
jgi:D-hydroxyproline dehydrogenase subunit beta